MTKNIYPFLPYGRQMIDKDDINSVIKVLKSNYLTEGPIISEFEKAFAHKVGSKYAVVCSSGTAGLHLASMCLKLNSNFTALVPAISFVATANAPFYTGANIEFVDVDPNTGLITADTLIRAIKTSSKKVKALFYVHLNGVVEDLTNIKNICDQYDIKIIEDSCHAIGGSKNSQKIGSCYDSDINVFSLHPVKTITMGEGGVITTNSQEYKNSLISFRSHGITKNDKMFTNNTFKNSNMYGAWSYEMQELGYNYRASTLNVALGLSQLKKLDYFVKKRSNIAHIYDETFKEMSHDFEPVKRNKNYNHGYHLYPILIKGKNPLTIKKRVIEFLKNKNIGSQVHYIPIPFQPFWKDKSNINNFKGAIDYFSRCLSIPIYPTMKKSEIKYVAESIRSAFKKKSN